MSATAAPTCTICVFAKPPRPGLAKTRLAQFLGAAGAAQLAAAMLADTLETVLALDWAQTILATTEPNAPEWRDCKAAEIWEQGSGDLGARMERILRRALGQSAAAIAVGADSPGLPAGRFETARAALLRSDAVVGPSADGGFYLMGLRRCPPHIFAGIAWSVPDTLQLTLARLRECQMQVEMLEPWFDVDEPADVRHLRDLVRDGRIAASRTAAVLQNHR